MEAFGIGGSVRKACQYAGVDENTLYREMERDPDFREQVARTRARVQLLTLQDLRDAGLNPMRGPGFLRRDAKALKDFLALTDPDEYGDRLNIRAEHRFEIVQVVMTAIQESVELVITDPETRVRLAEAISARLASAVGGENHQRQPALPPAGDTA